MKSFFEKIRNIVDEISRNSRKPLKKLP